MRHRLKEVSQPQRLQPRFGADCECSGPPVEPHQARVEVPTRAQGDGVSCSSFAGGEGGIVGYRGGKMGKGGGGAGG